MRRQPWGLTLLLVPLLLAPVSCTRQDPSAPDEPARLEGPSPVETPESTHLRALDDCANFRIPAGHTDTNLDEVAGVIEVHWFARGKNRNLAFSYRDPVCWERPATRRFIKHVLEARIYPTGPGDCEVAEPEVKGDFVLVHLFRRGATVARPNQIAPASRPLPPGETAPLTYALEELFSGTLPQERQSGCRSYFDSVKPSALRSVSLTEGHAVVDMDGDGMFALGATSATSFMLAQLEPTAFQFPTIRSVELRLDGSCERFGDAVQTNGCVLITRK